MPSVVSVESVVDGAVVKWTAPALKNVETLLEVAPDVAGVPGAWLQNARTSATTYSLALPAESRWVRLRTIHNSRTSEYTTPILAERNVAASEAAVVAAQATADHADALTEAGSGVQLGDQRQLMPVTVGSVRSLWDGITLTSSFDTATPAEVTLSVSAATLRVGSAAVSYSAASAITSQARSTTVRYYGYYLDLSWAGGARTLNITTDKNLLANTDGVVWVGEWVVVIGATGGGTGGGGAGGGGGLPGQYEEIL